MLKMALAQTYLQFTKEVSRGTSKSNAEILSLINELDHTDDDYLEQLTRLLVFLITKKPLVTPIVALDKNTNWMQYMKSNGIDTKASAMANTIKMLDKNPVNEWIITAYEDNWANTRMLVNYINGLTGKDKVPYIQVFLRSMYKIIHNGEKLKTEEQLRDMLTRPDLIDQVVAASVRLSGLKAIGGETTTNPSYYSWLTQDGNTDFRVLSDVIQSAEVAYDLGGGYCTPALSWQFNKKLIGLDLIDPAEARTDPVPINMTGMSVTVEEYFDLLDQQPWQEFNVFLNHIDSSANSYFITSFGFVSSTVSGGFANKTWIDTTYSAVKCIAELIAAGKDVYFILYGRPTIRVQQNKVIGMRFNNYELLDTEIYQDPFNTDTSGYNFGTTSQIRKNRRGDLDYIGKT